MIEKINYNSLYCMRIIKRAFGTFLEAFLVLYFFQLSDSNILPIGIYKLCAVITTWLIIFITRNICKTKHRIKLLRFGIIMYFIYFLSLILLKEKVVNYIALVGMIYGLAEGFYYSVYNMIESDGISNEKRQKFLGGTHAINDILSIVLPTFFGYIVLKTGFVNSLILIICIVTIQIVMSYLLKDINIPKHKKVDFKEFRNIVKNNNVLKLLFKMRLFEGILYAEGAFNMIVSLFIIRVFSDSFSLGIFTSIFSIVSATLGILFIKVIKVKHYKNLIIFSSLFTSISLIFMIINCNALSIIIFNFFHKISRGAMTLINVKNIHDTANDERIKNEYKVEYYVSLESFLAIGRVIGCGLFILMAFTNSNIILYIFALLLMICSFYVVKVQDAINKKA